MDEQSERAAIQRLRIGDILALTPLVKAFQQPALRAAFLVTQDESLAEDAVQTAFVQAYENIGQFDITRRFAPWFLRIAVNLAVQAARTSAKSLPLDAAPDGGATLDDLLNADTPDPETDAERRDLETRVQRLLERLTPDERAVIVLRYYIDLSEAQMSETLNVPPGTVKSRLHAARRQLRRLFLADDFLGDSL